MSLEPAIQVVAQWSDETQLPIHIPCIDSSAVLLEDV